MISVALVECAKPQPQQANPPQASSVKLQQQAGPPNRGADPALPNTPAAGPNGQPAQPASTPSQAHVHPPSAHPHPLIIPMIRFPGMMQPAGLPGVGMQILEIRPGLRIVTPQAFHAQNPQANSVSDGHGWHSVYDASLMIVCVLLIAALLHMYRARQMEPFHASTTKLSSSFELRPTAKYGSIDRNSDEAVL